MKPKPSSSKHSRKEDWYRKYENYAPLRAKEVNVNHTDENYFEKCDRTLYIQITYLTLYVN